ncbi:MAG: chemotaxis protein CheW [Clostridiaceae bacterium]
MKQAIIFSICCQNFALDVVKVERIIEFELPVKIPEAEIFLMGVIQYNGKVLPVIDMNMRFYGTASTHDRNSKIVVVQWNDTFLGLVVDEVTGIRNVDENLFESAVFSDGLLSREYVEGFIKSDDEIVIFLETSKLFDFDQAKELIEIAN